MQVHSMPLEAKAHKEQNRNDSENHFIIVHGQTHEHTHTLLQKKTNASKLNYSEKHTQKWTQLTARTKNAFIQFTDPTLLPHHQQHHEQFSMLMASFTHTKNSLISSLRS